MKRTLGALLVGILLGCAGTFATIEVAGGRYTYVLMGRTECEQGDRALGVGQVAPNQPNPCLLRFPRYH